MSYILDALKKSEQERGHGHIPDVQTVHSSSLNYRNDKKAYWPYILIVAVILNLLAISYFIFNKEKPVETPVTTEVNTAIKQAATENGITADKTDTPADASSAVNNIVNLEITEPLPGTATVTTNSPAKPASKETQPERKSVAENTRSNRSEKNSSTDIIDFHELPESIKQQLPAIIISAHVYSSNPLQRSIVINNNFMEEGEYVLDGLILHEITTNGAVFNYQGTLFNYGVVSGWQ